MIDFVSAASGTLGLALLFWGGRLLDLARDFAVFFPAWVAGKLDDLAERLTPRTGPQDGAELTAATAFARTPPQGMREIYEELDAFCGITDEDLKTEPVKVTAEIAGNRLAHPGRWASYDPPLRVDLPPGWGAPMPEPVVYEMGITEAEFKKREKMRELAGERIATTAVTNAYLHSPGDEIAKVVAELKGRHDREVSHLKRLLSEARHKQNRAEELAQGHARALEEKLKEIH